MKQYAQLKTEVTVILKPGFLSVLNSNQIIYSFNDESYNRKHAIYRKYLLLSHIPETLTIQGRF